VPGKFDFMKQMFKTYIKSIAVFVAGRWVSPRDSREDPDCAVVEVDADLSPTALKFIGLWVALLKKFDNRINTDHPIFMYLGETAEKGLSARVTFTISLRRRPLELQEHEGRPTWKTVKRKPPMLSRGKSI